MKASLQRSSGPDSSLYERELVVPQGEHQAVLLEFQLSRGPIASHKAQLMKHQDNLVLRVELVGNRAALVRAEDSEGRASSLPEGLVFTVLIEKLGEPLELAADPRWVFPNRDADLQLTIPLMPTTKEIFEERRRNILEGLPRRVLRSAPEHEGDGVRKPTEDSGSAAESGGLGSARWEEVPAEEQAELFLEAWDRETYTDNDAPKLWTYVSSEDTLSALDREKRLASIKSLTTLMYDRLHARGRQTAVPAVEQVSEAATSARLIGALHFELFRKFYADGGNFDVNALAELFLRFSNGEFLRPVGLQGREYLNGVPNGSVLAYLPEFAALLAADPRQPECWRLLLPTFVACILVYAHTYGHEEDQLLSKYGLSTFATANEPLSSRDLAGLRRGFESFARKGTVEAHWANALWILASDAFPESPLSGEFPTTLSYVERFTSTA